MQPSLWTKLRTAEQNKAYVSKGDVLTKGDIINLPDELEGKVINEPVVFEKGEPAPDKNQVVQPSRIKKANKQKIKPWDRASKT